MSFDLTELLDAVGATNQKLIDRSSEAQQILDSQKEAGDRLVAAQKTEGENTQIVQQAKELSALQQQQQTQSLASKMGINPNGAADVLDAVANEWKTATLNSIDKNKKLSDDLNVSFFDHPVDYVVAQVGMDKTIAQAKNASDRRGEAQKSFADIQTLTQQMPAQMAALSNTRTAATVQATLDAATAALIAKTEKTRIDLAGVQTDGLVRLNQMDTQQLNNMNTGFAMKNQQAHLDLARSQFALQQKAVQLQMEDRADRIETRKSDRAELEDTATTIRTGASIMGYEGASILPTNKIIGRLNSKDPMIMDMWKAGLASEATGHPVLSDSPGDVARIIVTNNAPLRPEQAAIKTFMQDVWHQSASAESAIAGGYDPKKLSDVTRAASGIALKNAATQMQNIKSGDNANIYSPPPLPTVLDLGPVKSSVWYDKVMKDQASTGQLKDFNPDQLISLTAGAVKNGTISFNDAAIGLQAAFGGARALNNLTRNYAGFGLPLQNGYNVKLQTGLGNVKNYNLVTPQDINSVLTKRISDEYSQSNPFAAPGFHD